MAAEREQREQVVGSTGARFGRVDRGRKRATPEKAPEPEVEPEEWDDNGPAVGTTGARFARPSRKKRRSRTVPASAAEGPVPPLVGPPLAWPVLPDLEYDPSEPDVADQSIRVRPYVLTGGRTQSRLPLPMEALVTTIPGSPTAHLAGVHLSVVQMCWASQSVAEVAARLSVPLGVARVLVDDLVASRSVTVHGSLDSHGSVPDVALMERVLAGLRRL